MLNTESLIIDSPVGHLRLILDNDCLTTLLPTKAELSSDKPSTLAKQYIAEIKRYFTKAGEFTLPIKPQGTPFQHKVWDAIKQIPLGDTLSYGDLAKILVSGAQAVGNACRHNPILLYIPCHRVTAKDAIGGFGGVRQGAAVAMKTWLLEHERKSN